jgi:hypothetical protein
MERTRALLFDSKLNKEIWRQILYAATYLQYRHCCSTIIRSRHLSLDYDTRMDYLNNLKIARVAMCST